MLRGLAGLVRRDRIAGALHVHIPVPRRELDAEPRLAFEHDARRVFQFSPSDAAWIWDSGWLLSAHAMLAMTAPPERT